MEKKLLIVSYFFPPFGEVGAVRITKFTKYLLRLGWKIKVITVDEKYYKTLNTDWLKEVKEAEILRSRRTKIKIPGINEQGFYWLPFLFRTINGLLKKENFKISFWTGGPFYHWILAPYLKRRFGLKYILDFRDPWRLNPYRRPKSLFSYLARILETIFEPLAIKEATYVINVTEEATELYKNFYPAYREKFITIPNGFDPEDLQNIEPLSFSSFDIVYVGKFSNFRNPIPFLKAFKKLLVDKKLEPKDVRFVWIGKKEKNVIKYIKKLELTDFVVMTGFKPYKEVLRYVKGAQLCLLITGNHPYEPTTKIFDYMGLKKRILGITSVEGFVFKVLRKYPEGVICSNREGQIYEALSESWESKPINNFKEPTYINKFDRSLLSLELNRVLEECLKLG